MKLSFLKIFFLLGTTFGLTCFAAESIESCSGVAELYGHHQNPHNISSECLSIVKNLSNEKTTVVTQNKKFKVYAHRNLIFVEKYQVSASGITFIKSEVLAGNQTKVTDVIAIKVDEINELLYVLNRNNDTISFGHYNLNFIGNVAPLRYFEVSNLNKPINFDIDSQEGFVYFIDQDDISIQKFNLHADVNGKMKEHSTQLQSKICGDNTTLLSPQKINIWENQIQVYDNGRIIRFEKGKSGNISPIN